ncbi:cytochrome c oxidase subunit II [Polymorphobacter arshaanensis]|uniref:Cytochrome c oxidase subunit 2 n=2 Tax=Glacieibacterium arshaanense TaxID=2511025 RepID=A0A4Y9EQ63_9SPHN|nr:cytochrome c oxidase subunit II [Polymorphobacter arshaanensis]
MRVLKQLAAGTGAAIASFAASGAAWAQEAAATATAAATTAAVNAAAAVPPTAPIAGIGQPSGARGVQTQFTPIGEEGAAMLNGILNPLIIGISIFVILLLLWTMVRFRAAANPVASRNSHNTLLEVGWTLVPVLILVWVAVPSFRLLANQYDPPKAELTIKATGHQWYWEYEYPDNGGFSFDAIALTQPEADKANLPYLLETDNRVVVPVGTTVKVLVTAVDVIHAWSIPSFWVQMDAVPGRINETWFKAAKEGVYYGQCNQLCGTRHGFMPITVEVVSKEKFAQWVAAKQKENGITPEAPAAADAAGNAAVAADAATATAVGGPAAPAPVAPATAEVTPAPAAAPAATN